MIKRMHLIIMNSAIMVSIPKALHVPLENYIIIMWSNIILECTPKRLLLGFLSGILLSASMKVLLHSAGRFGLDQTISITRHALDVISSQNMDILTASQAVGRDFCFLFPSLKKEKERNHIFTFKVYFQ